MIMFETKKGALIGLIICGLLSIISLICAYWQPWQLLLAVVYLVLLMLFINEYLTKKD